jgi:hypothetical protein
MWRASRVVLVCFLIAIATAAGVSLGLRATPPREKQQICERIEFENPLGSGVLMSLEEAERDFAPPVFRPQIDAASDGTIDELWVRASGSAEVYIVYESGVVVSVNRSIRPTWELARDQIADGVPGELISVRGVDVFTVPPVQACFGGNAVFDIDGAHVAVINDPDLPFDVVARATESIIDTVPIVKAADAAVDG